MSWRVILWIVCTGVFLGTAVVLLVSDLLGQPLALTLTVNALVGGVNGWYAPRTFAWACQKWQHITH